MSDDWMTKVCGVDSPATEEARGAEGIAALCKLADSVDAAPDGDARVAAFALWMQDGTMRAVAADAQLRSPAAVEGIIARLGQHRGLGGRAKGLHDALKQEAKAAAKAKRSDVAAEQRNPPSVAADLATALGSDDLPPGLLCPGGWEINREGVHRVRLDEDTGDIVLVPVAARPIIVAGRCREVGDGRTSVRLEWSTSRGPRHQIVSRGKVADSRSIVELAELDAPVHSNNARDLVQFIADFEAANAATLPEARVTQSMGWQGNATVDGFMWGRSHLLPGQPDAPGQAIEDLAPSKWEERQIHLLVDDGGRDLANGFRAEGTWEGWLGVVEAALPYPRVMLALYAALVPPLMTFLPTLPNFIVDYCGTTSEGKTTTLRLGVSAWGCPDERAGGALRSWDATRVSIERTAALLGSLPLVLDDTKRAKRPEDVARVLYDVAQGIGRARGSVGGLRDLGRWRTVLLSTGEVPATSFTNDGGTRARVLSLWGSPFGGTGDAAGAAVRRINEEALQHYGHAGPRLVRWLMDTPGARETVREAYRVARARWDALTNGNGVAGRAAQYVAGLEVAQELLHGVLGVPRPADDPLAHAWQAVCGACVEADRPSDALREVMSWATSQQARFYGRHVESKWSDDVPHAGWLGAWVNGEAWEHLDVLPTELRRFLTAQGHDVEAVVRTWDDRGWLLRDGAHRCRKVAVRGVKERCFVITRAACDQVQGAGDE